MEHGSLVFFRFVGSGGFAQGVLELVGCARLQAGIGGRAAVQDGYVGARVDVHAAEGLHGAADDEGAVAGAVVFGVGVIQEFGNLAALRLNGNQAFVLIVQGQAAVVHVQVHVGARVGGQHGPGPGGGFGIHHVDGGVRAHQVGAAGGAHDAQDPGRGHHQRLIGGVQVFLVQGAAVGTQHGGTNRQHGPAVREDGQRRHARHMDGGVF